MVLADFKLKYATSALGYVWSVIKPLSIFTIMYLVFGRISSSRSRASRSRASHRDRALLLLLRRYEPGHGGARPSRVAAAAVAVPAHLDSHGRDTDGGDDLWHQPARRRRVRGVGGIVPQPDWLLLVPLLLELYIFTLGIALILTTLFVSLRDMGQVWELGLQILFYASPIIYPVSYLPPWARTSPSCPFTQVLQDVRTIVLSGETTGITVTSAEALVRSASAADRDHAGRLRDRWHSSSEMSPGLPSALEYRARRHRRPGGVEDLPAAARAANDAEGVLPAPASPPATRSSACSRRSPSVSRRASSSGRSDRTERQSTLLKIIAGIDRDDTERWR